MKKWLFLLLIPAVAAAMLLLSSYSGDECDYPSGAPAGYTGSPGDGNDCTSCHGGSSTPVTDWITSDIPAEGYTAGTTYNITVTVTGTGKKGFEVSPQNLSGTQLGTLIAGTGSHLTGGTKYVTQNSASNSNPATWTFEWTAPAAGTGDVTFYGAFAVSKSSTKTSSLTVAENAVIPLIVEVSADPMTIDPGDSTHLNATPSGGNGNYTYIWTSSPAGFSSDQKSPWSKPVVNTQYTVTVSDGSGTAQASVDVTVTTVGMADPDKSGSLTVSPNPSDGRFRIAASLELMGEAQVRIFNLQGGEIWTRPLEGTAGQFVTEADLTRFPDGIYLVTIAGEKQSVSVKIIKSGR
jgi:hypothetical protein